MGGELTPVSGSAELGPRSLITALKDPESANLDRVPVVKGWLDSNGETHEQVYNVAWTGNRSLDDEGQLPQVGDTGQEPASGYPQVIQERAYTSPIWVPAQRR